MLKALSAEADKLKREQAGLSGKRDLAWLSSWFQQFSAVAIGVQASVLCYTWLSPLSHALLSALLFVTRMHAN